MALLDPLDATAEREREKEREREIEREKGLWFRASKHLYTGKVCVPGLDMWNTGAILHCRGLPVTWAGVGGYMRFRGSGFSRFGVLGFRVQLNIQSIGRLYITTLGSKAFWLPKTCGSGLGASEGITVTPAGFQAQGSAFGV